MTQFNPEDPKWTAYVFGELDESERAAVELELEASEEARMLVEELRFAADLTKAELREAVTVTPLTQEQREKIHVSASADRPRRWFGSRYPIWTAGLAAAAAAVFLLAALLAPVPSPLPQQIASAPPPDGIADARQPEQAAAKAKEDSVRPSSDFGLRYDHPAPQSAAPQLDEKKNTVAAVAKTAEAEVPQTAPGVPVNEAAPAAVRLEAPPPPIAAPARAGVLGTVQDAAATNAPGVNVTATNKNEKTVEASRDAGAAAAAAAGAAAGGAAAGGRNQIGQSALADSLRSNSFGPAPRAPGVPPALDRRRTGFSNGAYDAINDNPFLTVDQNHLSTFSIDVDTAAYSNLRGYLNQNQLPPRDAVRIEEMINYFAYDYPQPSGNNPIGASIEAASAPWNPQHRLVRVAIKARDLEARRRPSTNLVFLIDVSGSMQPAERLPLLKDGLRMLVDQLTANDRVTVVTYAGTTGVALRPTRGDQKDVILSLIGSLQAGGSTNGGSGIQLAYEQAAANFIPGGVNRVILATDGDFNVGITDRSALLRLIEEKARSGVFLSVLGVGMGNYKDATLETLADKGNGNYAYLDTLNEARKVLVDQMTGTLVTVAKDVKVQVEFNPAVVDAYRLIGYENRALRNEDFNNDLKDAGDMGAGHTVTVLYEVVPRGVAINGPGAPGVDPLKYQQPAAAAAPAPARNASNETLTVKIRYKEPTGSDSKLLEFPLVDREQAFARSGVDFRFAAAVASFGMIMRDSPYRGTATIDTVLSIAEDSLGSDRNGYRREFLQLVQRARQIRGR